MTNWTEADLAAELRKAWRGTGGARANEKPGESGAVRTTIPRAARKTNLGDLLAYVAEESTSATVKRSTPSLAALIRPPRPARTLQPEESLSHAVAWMLADMAEAGRLRALPIMTSPEHRASGRAAAMHQHIRRVMGAWLGMPDWVFVGFDGDPPGISGVLELKRAAGERRLDGTRPARGELSAEQRQCREVCKSLGVPWACVRTVDEARRALEEMGVVTGEGTP